MYESLRSAQTEGDEGVNDSRQAPGTRKTDLLFVHHEEATLDVGCFSLSTASTRFDVRAATICGFTSHSQVFD